MEMQVFSKKFTNISECDYFIICLPYACANCLLIANQQLLGSPEICVTMYDTN